MPDFSLYRQTLEKKKAFFRWLRPIVRSENKRILEQRQRLLSIPSDKTIKASDYIFIQQLARRYKLPYKKHMDVKSWQALLSRVDSIPIKLVLAQAANESAWGTSRFAVQGNNLFGIWCFSKGCGLVPLHRSAGKTHEVAVFSSSSASVASYMRTINTKQAYQPLRKIRAAMRRHHLQPTAKVLVKGLEKYSELGKRYVHALQSMIKKNGPLMEEN